MRMIINIVIGLFLLGCAAAFTLTGLLAWDVAGNIGGKIIGGCLIANGMIALGGAIFGYMRAA